MPVNLLLIESATAVCSVAVCRDEEVIASRISSEERDHARILAVFVKEVMEEAGLALREIDAVAISRGPGSYTGLRIGVATANGICYALDKRLIAVDTPLVMACLYKMHNPDLSPDTVLVPVIDARRMEVYGAAIDMELNYLEDIKAEVLSPASFIIDKNRHHVVFGDAAAKCVEIYKGESYVKVDCSFVLSAQGLLLPAIRKYYSGEFEDINTFEPYYLKEFVAKTKKPVGE